MRTERRCIALAATLVGFGALVVAPAPTRAQGADPASGAAINAWDGYRTHGWQGYQPGPGLGAASAAPVGVHRTADGGWIAYRPERGWDLFTPQHGWSHYTPGEGWSPYAAAPSPGPRLATGWLGYNPGAAWADYVPAAAAVPAAPSLVHLPVQATESRFRRPYREPGSGRTVVLVKPWLPGAP
jgi:hypothetical protein